MNFNSYGKHAYGKHAYKKGPLLPPDSLDTSPLQPELYVRASVRSVRLVSVWSPLLPAWLLQVLPVLGDF